MRGRGRGEGGVALNVTASQKVFKDSIGLEKSVSYITIGPPPPPPPPILTRARAKSCKLVTENDLRTEVIYPKVAYTNGFYHW